MNIIGPQLISSISDRIYNKFATQEIKKKQGQANSGDALMTFEDLAAFFIVMKE